MPASISDVKFFLEYIKTGLFPQDSICHMNPSLLNPVFPILSVTSPFTHAQSIILLFSEFIFKLYRVQIWIQTK